MNQKIYRNWDTKKTVDVNNAVSGVLLNIAYPQKPTFEIAYRDDSKQPIDLSSLTFRAAIDTDFDTTTDVMSRTVVGQVDMTQAALGIIKVPNNADNARFYSQVNAQKNGVRQATFQIYGYNSLGEEEFFDTMTVNAIMPVDPLGATEPPPDPEVEWASRSWADARYLKTVSGTQVTLTDNQQTAINILDKTLARKATIEMYVLSSTGLRDYMPFAISWFGSAASLQPAADSNIGSFPDCIILDADISGDNVRLLVNVAGAGENLKLVYRASQLPLES